MISNTSKITISFSFYYGFPIKFYPFCVKCQPRKISNNKNSKFIEH